MAFYDKFPYTNFQELNLDKIMHKIGDIDRAEEASAASAAAAKESEINAGNSEQAAAASASSASQSADASKASANASATSATESAQYLDEIGTHTAGVVADWLAEHLTPTTPPIDTSLTIAGAAADAQVTGAIVTDLNNGLNNISEIIGHDHFQNNFQTGAYSQTGVVANTGRAYCIYTGVQKGSKLFWDASKWTVNYYYLTSETDFTPLHTPNVWDDTGEITLNYKDDGIVFIAVRAGVSSLTSRLEEINHSVWLYNNFAGVPLDYNGVVSGETLASNNKLGFYSIGGYTTSVVSNMTDMPCDDFAGGYLLNTIVGSAGTIIKQTVVEIDIGEAVGRTFTRLINGNWYGTGYVNWVAFGDSITNGSFSDEQGHTLNDPRRSYVYRVAKNLKRDVVTKFYNCGVRGIGWINTGNNGETFSDMMALYTGDKTAINLVTVMLGINDYISAETLGTTTSEENDGTISGAIRYGLRYLCENYPNAKIVAISPLNSMNHGSASKGWSRNTRLTLPGSLQDVCDMIAYWCNIYNVTYINEISESFLNNYNMPTYLKDNLHPTDAGQWMLAKDIASKVF